MISEEKNYKEKYSKFQNVFYLVCKYIPFITFLPYYLYFTKYHPPQGWRVTQVKSKVEIVMMRGVYNMKSNVVGSGD